MNIYAHLSHSEVNLFFVVPYRKRREVSGKGKLFFRKGQLLYTQNVSDRIAE